MRKQKKKDLLVGTWISDDEFTSDIEYTVGFDGKTYHVTVVDTNDDEAGEVSDVHTDGGRLIFSVYWPSSGRFAKCKFHLTSKKQIEFTYTYTDHETMHKKSSNNSLERTHGVRRSA